MFHNLNKILKYADISSHLKKLKLFFDCAQYFAKSRAIEQFARTITQQ